MTRLCSSPSRNRRAALTLTLALLTTATVAGGAAAAIPNRSPQASQLAQLAQQVVDSGVPGVVVRVDDGHSPVVTVARQAPWTEADGRLTAERAFRMGSNTKTMVATLILQMVAEHRIALTDPVEKWLPGLVPNGSAITVRMLLNHTSGLFNDVDDPAVLAGFLGQTSRPWTPLQLLAAGVSHDPLFAPGTKYSYSNTNYVALGLILEKLTGKDVRDVIEQRIVRPLHLKHTYLAEDGRRDPQLAHGYEPDAAHLAPLLPPGVPAGTFFVGPTRGEYVDTTRINPNTMWAAGGMVSTADDWARFDRALLSGRLLPEAELNQMRTTVPEDPKAPNGNGYGLGLRKVTFSCGTVWGHDGQAPGYSTEAYTDRTGRRTVSLVTTTIFGVAAPKPAAAHQALIDAAVCTMLGRPIAAKG